MSDSATIIDGYLAAYGETNPARRKELIVQSFAFDATLVDPPLDAAGHDGIDPTAQLIRQWLKDASSQTAC